jgi:hypothetical protein
VSDRISRNFTVAEMTVSAAAARAGRTVELAEHVRPNLERLCEEILEPLRASLRKPIVVISGYRPPWLNRLVGGSPRSQHMIGEAADIIVPGLTPREVCERIVKLELPFHQLILEFPPQGSRSAGPARCCCASAWATSSWPGIARSCRSAVRSR